MVGEKVVVIIDRGYRQIYLDCIDIVIQPINQRHHSFRKIKWSRGIFNYEQQFPLLFFRHFFLLRCHHGALPQGALPVLARTFGS